MSAHLEEGRRAMRDDAVALHLPKAQAAIPRAPLNRLPGQDLHWTPAARVDLVIHLQNTVMTFTDAQSAYGESQSTSLSELLIHRSKAQPAISQGAAWSRSALDLC